MANTFYRKLSANVGTTSTSVGSYTVGASTTTVVVGLTICNVSGGTINVDVSLFNGSTDYYIVKNAPISSGGALVPIGGEQKVIMATGDSIRVKSTASSSADVILSIMEIT